MYDSILFPIKSTDTSRVLLVDKKRYGLFSSTKWFHSFGHNYNRNIPEVPQSPDARLGWAFIVMDSISMINLA